MRASDESERLSWAPGGPGSSDPDSEAGKTKKKKEDGVGFLKELPILIFVAVLIALVVKTFVVQAFYIPSGSMENTLLINDRVLVSKFIYDFSDPSPGQIVVFVAPSSAVPGNGRSPGGFAGFMDGLKNSLGLPSSNQRDFIKRVVATAGQTVEVKDGSLYVNNVKQNEPFVHDHNPGSMNPYGPITVPKNDLFVMGDNRGDSEDSRIFGPIAKSTVIGQAFLRIWPPGRFHFF